jgi:nicotinamidase/pyrazinamidase
MTHEPIRILFTVDPQNDFCPGGALAVTAGDAIFTIINTLSSQGAFDAHWMSSDCHPANHCSFAQWPVHCVAGTHGAAIHPLLNTSKITQYFKKGTRIDIDSYGIFFDNQRLESNGVKEAIEELCRTMQRHDAPVQITFTGLAFDYCVGASAAQATELGYDVIVITDATRSVNLCAGDPCEGIPSDEERMTAYLKTLGVRFLSSQEYLLEHSIDRCHGMEQPPERHTSRSPEINA